MWWDLQNCLRDLDAQFPLKLMRIGGIQIPFAALKMSTSLPVFVIMLYVSEDSVTYKLCFCWVFCIPGVGWESGEKHSWLQWLALSLGKSASYPFSFWFLVCNLEILALTWIWCMLSIFWLNLFIRISIDAIE